MNKLVTILVERDLRARYDRGVCMGCSWEA